MKKIYSYKKEVIFKNNIYDILSIAIDKKFGLDGYAIKGKFKINGEYLIKENEKDEFDIDIPYLNYIEDTYDISKIKVDIDDFYYEIKDSNKLIINIDIIVDGLEEKERCIDDSIDGEDEFKIELDDDNEVDDIIQIDDMNNDIEITNDINNIIDNLNKITIEDNDTIIDGITNTTIEDNDTIIDGITNTTIEDNDNIINIDNMVNNILESKEINNIVNIDNISNSIVENKEITNIINRDDITDNMDIEKNIDRDIDDNENNVVEVNSAEEVIKKEDKVVENQYFEENKTSEFVTYKVCIVRENDTIENILEKYNTSIDTLKKYNVINEIKTGDKIIIPYERN